MDKSIIIFCPNPYSLYTNSVCELLIRKGYTIDTIVIVKFSLNRFKREFARDGKRLFRKIYRKLILREKSYNKGSDNIISFRQKNKLKIKNVKVFTKHKTKLVYCETLNDKVVADALLEKENKLIVFTGGGIIRKNILELAGDGIINCHMGVLPKYKGMDLPEWCILEGNLDQLGITLHFMDTGLDTGDILKVIKVPLGDVNDIKELRNKFEPIMVNAMVEVIDEHLKGLLSPKPQSNIQPKQYFIVHPKLYNTINKKIDRLQATKK